eukprot:m.1147162 g.1147162  ORF g.1147162 m.1147162 type:complete len:553 (-) comp24470_c0_seq24:3272-4930(-)
MCVCQFTDTVTVYSLRIDYRMRYPSKMPPLSPPELQVSVKVFVALAVLLHFCNSSLAVPIDKVRRSFGDDTVPQSYTLFSDGQKCNTWGFKLIRDATDCTEAARQYRLPQTVPNEITSSSQPRGCYYRPGGRSGRQLFFNPDGDASELSSTRTQFLCVIHFETGEHGSVIFEDGGYAVVEDDSPVATPSITPALPDTVPGDEADGFTAATPLPATTLPSIVTAINTLPTATVAPTMAPTVTPWIYILMSYPQCRAEQGHVWITSLSECEDAAVSIGFTDDRASAKNDASLPFGCYIQNGKRLIFNDHRRGDQTHENSDRASICKLPVHPHDAPLSGEDSSVSPAPTSAPTDMQWEYELAGVAQCQSERDHEWITTAAECEQAAMAVGFADVEAAHKDEESLPFGCYTQNNRRLVFNGHSNGDRWSTNPDREAICKFPIGAQSLPEEYVEVFPTDHVEHGPAHVSSVEHFRMSATGHCRPDHDGVWITSAHDCETAARALSLPHWTAFTVDKPNRPRGCYFQPARSEKSLFFNTNTNLETGTEDGFFSLCAAQ